MKRTRAILKVLFLICLMLSFVFFLVACEEQTVGYTLVDGVYKNDNTTAMVLILGKHANAMEIPEDAYNQIEKLLDDTVYGGYICAIIVDSNPTKIELVENKDFFSEDARNPIVLSQWINTRKGQIMELVNGLTTVADSEEVDLLAAIREAINALSNGQAANAAKKRIVIIDTGISTTGDLNFCDMDFLYSKPDINEIVKKLSTYEGSGVLPDLTGVDVTFIGTADGLAEVAEPQVATTTDKKFIRDLWANVVTACGAESVSFESAAGWSVPNEYSEDDESKFKYVSVVTFGHESILGFSHIPNYDPNNPDQEPNLPNIPSLEAKLESQVIGFMPDSATFVNAQNTLNVLRPYADELEKFFKYYPNEKIWIVGTTAEVRKGSTGGYSLSFARAEAVKNILVGKFGIPDHRLLTIGVGCVFPWRVDEFPNGIFDKNAAQANRAVFLLSNSDSTGYFQKLKTAYTNNELLPETMSRYEAIYTSTPATNANYVSGLEYSGAIYSGYINKSGNPNGEGVMKYLDGSEYSGQWVDGVREGYGTMRYDNGVYEGEWKNGKRDGQGTYTWNDGKRYTGAYADDVRSGIGIFYSWVDLTNGYKGTYFGESKNDQFDGVGYFLFDNGDKFEGIYKKNSCWTGTYTRKDGSSIEVINGEPQ